MKKYSPIASIIAAAACPICFPKLALIGALIGVGGFAQYEIYFLIAAQLLVLVSLFNAISTYRKIRNSKILMLVVSSVALFFISLYVFVNEYLSYLGLAGLVAGMIWQLKGMKSINNNSN